MITCARVKGSIWRLCLHQTAVQLAEFIECETTGRSKV